MEESGGEKPGVALQEESPERRLSQLLGASLEGKVREKTDEFGGLLTREAAVQLLCMESGISSERKLALSQAHSSSLPFSFCARVERVFPPQQFPGGALSVRLHVSDKSGVATLVLWNEQAELAEGIFAGDGICCTGAHFRSGEISLSRRGTMARTGAYGAVDAGSLKEGVNNVQGIAASVEAPRAYKDRSTGAEKTMLAFRLQSGGRSVRAVAWAYLQNEPPLREGEEVVLENAVFKNGELHLNAFSRIARKGGGGKEGKFRGAAIEGGRAVLSIDGEEFSMPLQEALASLGVNAVPPGVDASTLLSIKSGALEGKAVLYFSEGNKLSAVKPLG